MAAKYSKLLLETTIPSDCCAGREVMNRVLGELESVDWIQDELFGVQLAFEEAIVNAIRHGNRQDTAKQVHVRCKLSRDRLRIEIEDEGEGFNPLEVPDPTEEGNLEMPSGRGIMLMRSFMTRVEYNDQGNRVIMEKCRVCHGTPQSNASQGNASQGNDCDLPGDGS